MSILDKEWERIQERAFTKWVNSHLKRRGLMVEDISKDLSDGVKLINLYEAISEESLGKYYKEPKMKFHQIANLNTVVDKINGFVSSAGIKVQFSAEQIFEGDKRQILGMIWCLIHKFEIQDISEDELSAKEGLLLWCQKKTAGYKDVKVDNFHNSWQDGLAFCALIHRHRPDLLDFDSLSKENKKENLELAFEVAERELDIPQLLEAQDMIDYKPDEKVVMAYVAFYWKKFASSQKSEKAANVIGKNIGRQKELEQLQSDYEQRAEALLGWIAGKQNDLSDTSAEHFGNSLEPVTERNVAFKDYKNNERPQQLAEKLNLEVLLANLRSQQKNAGLPLYTPPEELSTETINDKWGELNNTQEAYEKALNERVSLMKRLEIQLNRFRSRSEKIQQWQETKSDLLAAEDVVNYTTVAALQNRIKQTEAFADELGAVRGNLEQTKQIGQTLVDNQHASAEEVSSTVAKFDEQHNKIGEQSTNLNTALEEALRKLEELIEKSLQYAKIAEVVNLAVVEAYSAANTALPSINPNDVETYQDNLAKAANDLSSNEDNLQNLLELKNEITEVGGETSAFSPHSAEELQQRFNETKEKLVQCHSELAEALKVDYETRAKDLSDWIRERQQHYSDVSNLGNSLEQILPTSDSFKQHKYTDKPHQEAIKKELASLLGLLMIEINDYDAGELNTDALEQQWTALHETESAYEEALRERTSLMQKLEVTLNKIRAKSSALQSWQLGKIESFDSEDIASYDAVSQMQAKLKSLETFSDEFGLQKKNLQQVEEFANELQQNDHTSKDEVATTVSALKEQEQQLSDKYDAFQTQLEEKLSGAQSLISLGLEFSRNAEQINLALEDAALTLIEPVQASSVIDVDTYDTALTKVAGDIDNTATSLEHLSSLSQQIADGNGNVSEYSSHSLESLKDRYDSTKESIEKRKAELAEERIKQENNASLLQQYSDECAEYSAWVDVQKDSVSAEQEGDLIEQLAAAQKLDEVITATSAEKLSNLEQLSKQLDEADIAEQAEMSVQALHTLDDQLKNLIKKRIETIEQQILAEKAANVSEEQLDEFKRTFDHFDKDKSGALSKLEFKACLASLGEDVSDEEFEKTFALLDTSGDGQISFEEFLAWISAIKREGTGYDDVLKAFEVLSGGSDTISEAQLRSSGMAPEEVDYLLEKMPQKDDGYDYRSYLASQYGHA